MQVGALNATLGLVTNKGEWQRGEAQINHFRRLALGVSAYFGGKWLGKAFIGFNRDVEDAKNQIASMLGVAKGTGAFAELQNASTLYDELRKKAAELPGETADYVKMLGMLVDPMARVKLGMTEMNDITVGAFTTARAWGDQWQASARDIGEFINFGKINKVDRYLRRLLTGTGIDATDEGRAKAAKLGARGRADLIHKQTTSPQIKEMQTLMSSSMSGRLDKVKDTIKQIMGKAGEALFGSMKESLTKLNAWLDANKTQIVEWASKVGAAVNTAFLALKDGILWLADHKDVVLSILGAIGVGFGIMATRAVAAWVTASAPLAAVGGLIWLFLKLKDLVGTTAAAFITLGVAIAGAFAYHHIGKYIAGLKAATTQAALLSAQQAWTKGGAATNAMFQHAYPGGAAPATTGAPAAAGAKAGTPGMGLLPGLGLAGAIMMGAGLVNDLTGGSIDLQGMMKKWQDTEGGTKKPIEQVTVNQAPVTVNITATNPVEAAAEFKKIMDQRDAEARAAFRAGAGNRGDGT